MTLLFHLNPFIFVLALVISTQAIATEKKSAAVSFEQNHISCSVITNEYLTILQLFQRGLPLDTALSSLPRISEDAKKRVDYIYYLARNKGVLNAYSDINTNFARCATMVHKLQGVPAPDDAHYGYYFCAGENKIRFEIILQYDAGKHAGDIYESVPTSHRHVVDQYLSLINQKGNIGAFDVMASNFKQCLGQIN